MKVWIKTTLQVWVHNYQNNKNLTRRNRKHISYKVKKEQMKSALDMIDKNEQLTMDEILFEMKHKYKDFDITRQQLGTRTTQERMVEFLETQIFPKYKDHIIILDNSKSHNNQMVKDDIKKSGNKYLFSISYTTITNYPIENYFNQHENIN